MSLTSEDLFVTVLGFAVAVTIATVAGWNVARGPAPLRWLIRLAMVGTCQMAAIAAVALWVNDSNDLYTSWSDLFDRRTPVPTAPAPIATVTDDVAPVSFHSRGDGLLDADYRGVESGLTGQVMVWTPPQYRDPAYRGFRFPVIMLLHGVPGSPQGWVSGGGATTLVADMMRRGGLTPAVLVIPRVDPEEQNTECSDIPHGPQVATWLSRDVPDLITQHFRVIAQPSGWAIVGVSTGGYCAAKLPLQYSGRFASGVAIGPDDFSGDPSVLTDKDLRIRNNPIRLAAIGSGASIIVATSRDDRFSTPTNAMTLRVAARPPTEIAAPIILRATIGEPGAPCIRPSSPGSMHT